MIMKVVLAARFIPEGAIVTKVTGQKEYKLTSEIKFYGEGAPENVTADKNIRFLVNDGQINIITADKELMWRVEANELRDHIEYERLGMEDDEPGGLA